MTTTQSEYRALEEESNKLQEIIRLYTFLGNPAEIFQQPIPQNEFSKLKSYAEAHAMVEEILGFEVSRKVIREILPKRNFNDYILFACHVIRGMGIYAKSKSDGMFRVYDHSLGDSSRAVKIWDVEKFIVHLLQYIEIKRDHLKSRVPELIESLKPMIETALCQLRQSEQEFNQALERLKKIHSDSFEIVIGGRREEREPVTGSSNKSEITRHDIYRELRNLATAVDLWDQAIINYQKIHSAFLALDQILTERTRIWCINQSVRKATSDLIEPVINQPSESLPINVYSPVDHSSNIASLVKKPDYRELVNESSMVSALSMVMKYAKLMDCSTHATQTTLSSFKNDVSTQMYLPQETGMNTVKHTGSYINTYMIPGESGFTQTEEEVIGYGKPVRYLWGLRGDAPFKELKYTVDSWK